jgi:hypothetical protein
MSHLREVKDLLSILPEGLPAGVDPAAALERRGHTIEPELAELLRTSAPHFRLSEAARARLRSRIPAGTKLVAREMLSAGPVARAATPIAAAPAYDLVLALRLSFANQVIAQLRAEGLIPSGLELAQTAELFSPGLLARFQLAPPHAPSPLPSPFPLPHPFPTVPGAPISGTPRALQFSAPPFLDTASGAELIEVVLPFRLDVDLEGRVPSTRAILGRIRAQVDIRTQVPTGSDSANLTITLDPNQSVSLHVEYNAGSQLIPRSLEDASAIDSELQFKLGVGLAQLPAIALPPLVLPTSALGGSDQSVVPLRVDPATTAQGGDTALVVGVQMTGNSSVPPQPPSPFTSGTGNAFVRLHEGFLSRVFRASALDPGFAAELEAESGLEGLQVDDAYVRASPDKLELIVEARIVNLCAFRKDLRFISTTTLTFSVFSGELTITRESVLDINNLDVILCILLAGVEIYLFRLPFAAIDHVLRFRPLLRGLFAGIRDGAGGGGEEGADQTIVAATFTTKKPIPGTEHAVSAELLQQKVDSVAVLALGELSLVPDTQSTFVHVRCLLGGAPVAGALVELMDQDAPPPVGDDAKLLGLPPNPSLFTPGPDQVVATATTDATGAARFFLAADGRPSAAGTVQLGFIPLPAREAAPDLYLRVTAPDGTLLDSRTVNGGFRLNQGAGHFGTREAPLVLNLPV